MSAAVTCIACQMGDHDHHTEWVTKPPPGVLGGAMCICPGGCVDTLSARFAEMFTGLTASVKSDDRADS